MVVLALPVDKEISIHALREEGDMSTMQAVVMDEISIHALREEGDRKTHFYIWPYFIFLSTPSARRATCRSKQEVTVEPFLSTPSARRATIPLASTKRQSSISIHALREEGDRRLLGQRFRLKLFLSTPSARRATYECFKRRIKPNVFLSTPSARRATLSGISRVYLLSYFYPRPPRGGRLLASSVMEYFRVISIHALREEGDTPGLFIYASRNRFLSTPSARRATPSRCHLQKLFSDFYPRPPRGGRHEEKKKGNIELLFLSTPSARRATQGAFISAFGGADFYPRPPRGGRPNADAISFIIDPFLSTPSARRATPFSTPLAMLFRISIHALREEGDHRRSPAL